MDSTRIPELTLMGKLMLIPHFGKVLLATGLRIFTSPLRLLTGGTSANTWLKDIVYSAIRANISAMTPAQENYVKGSTEAIYLDFAKKAKFQPDTDALPSGMKVHWLGTKNAENIIVYLHGGGYVMPALPGHVQWCYEMAKSMSEQDGRSISCVFPSYTLAPQAQYPTQLKQAVECIDMLINKMGKKPSNVGQTIRDPIRYGKFATNANSAGKRSSSQAIPPAEISPWPFSLTSCIPILRCRSLRSLSPLPVQS